MYPYKIFGDFDLYTICITLGAAACLVVFRLLADRLRLSARLTNLTLAAGVTGMAAGLGSAVLFQAFYDYLAGYGFFIDEYTGATFYGGLIGGAALFLLVYFLGGHFLLPRGEARKSFFATTSLVAVSITLAHACGRIGCFFAGCCHGLPTTSIFGLYFPALDTRVYPTQLYEALFLLLLSAFLAMRALRGKRDGFPLYLVAYGVFRYFIEFLRGDDRGASPVPFLSPSQLTALVLVAVGFLLFWVESRQKTPAAEEFAILPDGEAEAAEGGMDSTQAAAEGEAHE